MHQARRRERDSVYVAAARIVVTDQPLLRGRRECDGFWLLNHWRPHIVSGDDPWNLVSYEIGGTQTQVAEIDHRQRIGRIPIGDRPKAGTLAVPVQAIRFDERLAR